MSSTTVRTFDTGNVSQALTCLHGGDLHAKVVLLKGHGTKQRKACMNGAAPRQGNYPGDSPPEYEDGGDRGQEVPGVCLRPEQPVHLHGACGGHPQILIIAGDLLCEHHLKVSCAAAVTIGQPSVDAMKLCMLTVERTDTLPMLFAC